MSVVRTADHARTLVTFSFPSKEWVAALGHAINASDSYREAAREWTHGAVALVVNAQADIGIADPVGIWLDLERGACREAKLVSMSDADRASFVLSADYARWKEIIRRELGPVAGIMQRKIALKGPLPIIVRFVKAAEELVAVATGVPTTFVDEAERQSDAGAEGR